MNARRISACQQTECGNASLLPHSNNCAASSPAVYRRSESGIRNSLPFVCRGCRHTKLQPPGRCYRNSLMRTVVSIPELNSQRITRKNLCERIFTGVLRTNCRSIGRARHVLLQTIRYSKLCKSEMYTDSSSGASLSELMTEFAEYLAHLIHVATATRKR